MKKFTLLILLNSFSLFSKSQILTGDWHAALQLNDTIELPFTFSAKDDAVIIHNGKESIITREIIFAKDSVTIQMPVFDSELRCKIDGRRLSGNFINHARKVKNVIPFHAEHGLNYRFSGRPAAAVKNISGKYHVIFNSEDEESKDAVGVFEQEGNRLAGTFLTTTGDYRYLDGEVDGNRIWLSAFDGSHLFLFTALIKNDSLISGEFFSGQHWHDTWQAVKDENVKLLPEDSITSIKPGFENFNFSFSDENGKMISLSDKRFANKNVIVQVMGSWCPNCMDESKFLSSWYNNNKKNNIEIIALDYEKIVDKSTAAKNIKRLKKHFDIHYPVLFAGSADKKEAALTLPMLNRIFAFPTMIFLNKDKKVVKIHTGFNGPATGEEYEKFKEYFQKTVDQLR